MNPWILLFVSLLPIVELGAAENLDDALAWSREELTKVQKELAEQRELIVDEKVPLARELREVQTTLMEQTEIKRKLEAQREGGRFELDQLKSEEASTRESANYLRNQATRIRQDFEADLLAGERVAYAETLLAVEQSFEDGDFSVEEAQTQWTIIEAALDRIDRMPGGRRFETEAVSSVSILTAGTALQFGPVIFFHGKDGDEAGSLVADETLQAKLRTINPEHAVAVQALMDGEAVSVSFDPTLGQAALIQQETVSILEHLALGGFWMIPICAFGLVTLLIVVWKWLTLNRVKLPTIPEYLSLAHDGNADLSQFSGETKLLVSRLLSVETAPAEVQEAELDVAYQEFKFKMNRWLPVIALTAGVSPLLGLLGTVTGMIKTFQLISLFGAGDAKLLSSGISEALITTEFGLVVAIPALVFHTYLQRRAKKILVSSANLMEQASRKVGG